MSYTIKVSFPNLDDGAEVLIQGLPILQNNVATTLTDEQIQTYKQFTSYQDYDFNAPMEDQDRKMVLGDFPGVLAQSPYITVTQDGTLVPRPVVVDPTDPADVPAQTEGGSE